MKNCFSRLCSLIAVFLFISGAQSQAIINYAITSGAGSYTSGSSTMVFSIPYFSTASGGSSTGALNPGFMGGGLYACEEPDKPTVTLTNGYTETATLTSSSTEDNQWYRNEVPIPGATGQTLPVSDDGIYSVRVGSGNCVSEFSDDVFIVITGDLPSLHSEISIYPIPFDDHINILGLEADSKQAVLLDMSGRATVLGLESVNHGHWLNVKDLASGLYLIRITNKDKVIFLKGYKR